MSKHVTRCTIDDVTGEGNGYLYTPEQAKAIIASYPAHERKARARGEPVLGSGRIFALPDEIISIDAFDIPHHWAQIGGLDFGWDHPTAGVKCAIDRDSDIFYVTSCYKRSQATPIEHIATLKAWGDRLKWAWPHDGLQHDKGSGRSLRDIYAKGGLSMLGIKACFVDGSYGVEAGLMEMLERMMSGRFKVFSHLNEWFEEFRLYHRDNGKVIKEFDDIMSATRYALMMARYAKPLSEGGIKPNKASYDTFYDEFY